MKRRSAMLLAAGLVVALAIAGVAFSLGATGPASAGSPGAASRQDPVVRTVTRVVTVHVRGDAVTASGGGAATGVGTAVPRSDDETDPPEGDDDTTEDDDPFEEEDDVGDDDPFEEEDDVGDDDDTEDETEELQGP